MASAPNIISRFWKLRKQYPVTCLAIGDHWQAGIGRSPDGRTVHEGVAATQSAAMQAAMDELERREKK